MTFADANSDFTKDRCLGAMKPLAPLVAKSPRALRILRHILHAHGRNASSAPGIWKLDGIRISLFVESEDQFCQVLARFDIGLKRQDIMRGEVLTCALLRNKKKEFAAGATAVIQMRMLVLNFIKGNYTLSDPLLMAYADFKSFDEVWPSEKYMMAQQKLGKTCATKNTWWLTKLKSHVDMTAEPAMKELFMGKED